MLPSLASSGVTVFSREILCVGKDRMGKAPQHLLFEGATLVSGLRTDVAQTLVVCGREQLQEGSWELPLKLRN